MATSNYPQPTLGDNCSITTCFERDLYIYTFIWCPNGVPNKVLDMMSRCLLLRPDSLITEISLTIGLGSTQHY